MVCPQSECLSSEASSIARTALQRISRFALNIRFPGQYFDAETGLHYSYHRYYDPSLGRYISADPIGQAGGVNVYGYVLNDPLNEIDPLGLLGWGEAYARYLSGKGGVHETPFSEHDPGFGPEAFPGFNEAMESGGSQSFESTLTYDTNEAPGNIDLRLTGEIECHEECGLTVCTFTGEVGADDNAWDFDERPYGVRDPDGPPYPKEWSTRAGAHSPGKAFDVRFTGSRSVTSQTVR